MKKILFPLFVLFALVLSACIPGLNEPIGDSAPEPTAEVAPVEEVVEEPEARICHFEVSGDTYSFELDVVEGETEEKEMVDGTYELTCTADGKESIFVPAPVEAPEVEAVEANADTSDDFVLTGSRFPGYVGDQLNTAYDVVVTSDGRFYQPSLPAKKTDRAGHTVAIELPPGPYDFYGVECTLHVDAERNGDGSDNPATVEEGNNLLFTVELPGDADYETAWAYVQCNNNPSTGFDMYFLGN